MSVKGTTVNTAASFEGCNETAVPVWLDTNAESIGELRALSALKTPSSMVPHAEEIIHQIPVYDGKLVRSLAQQPDFDQEVVQSLQQEWVRVLLDGAGVIAIRDAIGDLRMLDGVTRALQKIMDEEAKMQTSGDHFAAAGSNSRLWNAHEKLCMHAPELFARYNANDVISLVCTAWLGPAYQITTQANIVHPGGRAQTSHRDYHLGFQDAALLSQYPAHVHAMSPLLTLQGGIAHSDVPLESGPTQLLPFSQKLLSGYLCVTQPEVQAHFLQHHVQLALAKGDMLFFNPALMHAAGDNDTVDQHRFVNLLQVGSAYGRTMEILDRARMATELYPVLIAMKCAGSLSQREIVQAVEACAEGYAFPANMDLEPPVGGMAPPSQQAMMLRALDENMSASDFTVMVRQHQALKRSSCI